MAASNRPAALVLSGGGTRGAFEAGAVDLLVADGMTCPAIITGTSAGSISAGVLAQARGESEFAECAAILRADILAMTQIDKVFAKTDWASQLDGTPAGEMIHTLLGRGRPPVPGDASLAVDPLADLAVTSEHRDSWKSLARTLLHPGAVHRATKDFWNDPASLMTLDPLEAALRGANGAGISKVDEARVARPGMILRLTVSALQGGVPRYVTRAGQWSHPMPSPPMPLVATRESSRGCSPRPASRCCSNHDSSVTTPTSMAVCCATFRWKPRSLWVRGTPRSLPTSRPSRRCRLRSTD